MDYVGSTPDLEAPTDVSRKLAALLRHSLHHGFGRFVKTTSYSSQYSSHYSRNLCFDSSHFDSRTFNYTILLTNLAS